MTTSAPSHVASPCTGVCRIGARGWCMGCRRTLDEIAAWPQLDDDARRRVLVAVHGRRPSDDDDGGSPPNLPPGARPLP